MATKIDTVEARSKLKPRAAPYWQRISAGCHVGFRRMSVGSIGTWIAQAYDGATRKQTRRSLGSLDTFPPNQRFDEARKRAEGWAHHLACGGVADAVTVRQACEQYVAHLRFEGKVTTADEMANRFSRWVYGERLALLALRKLAPHHVREWRRQLIAKPVVVNPHARQYLQRTRPRAPASVNRELTALRAALNLALENGAVTTDAAWRLPLRAIENADRRRNVYRLHCSGL
jgi:hypothetical protein